MIIRKATPKDYKEISLIYKEEFGKKPYHEKWTEESAFQKIKEYSKNHILVAEKEKKVIGFIIFSELLLDDGPRTFIDELVITEKFQKQGIGHKLIAEVETFSKNNNKIGILLLAHEEANAIEFYNKLKFKKEKWVLFDKKL
ncbi:GNAT family N-acetyltransferase [Candidatus Woesearchaeota archaeon]|jgi:predicted N-acetyltransferase YhbS|nr:GNAT family N-acetyltransferase [Candidatus Woesearchaeota archaeon]MBT5342038.1 GNAT family N-acetyltransferase [Candidatus Woesearchaeota archaeon]